MENVNVQPMLIVMTTLVEITVIVITLVDVIIQVIVHKITNAHLKEMSVIVMMTPVMLEKSVISMKPFLKVIMIEMLLVL